MKLLIILIFLLFSIQKDNVIEDKIYINIIEQLIRESESDTLILINESIIFNPFVNNEIRFDSLLISKLNSEFKNDFNKKKKLNIRIDSIVLSDKYEIIWVDKSYFDSIFYNQELKFHQMWDLLYSRYSSQYNVVLLSSPFFNKQKNKLAVFVNQMKYGNGSGIFYYFTLKKNKWVFKNIEIVYKS